MTDREIVEKLAALVSSCPVGHAHGHIVTHRAFEERELIEWLDELHALRNQIQPKP